MLGAPEKQLHTHREEGETGGPLDLEVMPGMGCSRVTIVSQYNIFLRNIQREIRLSRMVPNQILYFQHSITTARHGSRIQHWPEIPDSRTFSLS